MHAEDLYLFRHAMVRDAAYELQPPGERADMHTFVLEILEGAFDDPAALEPWAYDLAEHARLAQQGRRGADDVLADKQLCYLLMASEFERRSYDPEQGIEINRSIAAHPKADAEQRARALERESSLLVNVGRPEEARGTAEQAIAAAEGLNALLYVESCSTLGVIYLDQGRFDEAFVVISRAVKTAEADGTPEVLAKAYGAMARFYDASDQLAKAEAEYRKAAELGRANGMRSTEGVALVNLGGMMQESGRGAEAREALLRAVELLEEGTHLKAKAVALGNLGWVQQNNAETEAAEATLLSAVEVATRAGSRYDLAVILGNLANTYFELNRDELAFKTYRQALEQHLELGTRRHEGIVRSDLAHALGRRGLYEEAEYEFRLAIALGEEMRNTRGVYMAKINLAETLRKLGREAESVSQLEAGYALARERKDWQWIVNAEEQLFDWRVAEGDERAAEQALQRVLDSASQHGKTFAGTIHERVTQRFREAFARDAAFDG